MEKEFFFKSPMKTTVTANDIGITISRKGLIGKSLHGLKGAKTIPYSSITAVQMKSGTMLTNGYLQLSLPGGVEATKGIQEAVKDENTVMFTKADNDLASELKQLIESHMGTAGAPAASASVNPVEQVKQLKELLDMGAITQQEFDAKKKDLLGL